MGRIRGIHLENYRSVEQRIDLLVPQDKPLVLIGPNNAGKSNIVRAIDLVLGERWPGNHEPEYHEFHQSNTDCVPLRIWFDLEDFVLDDRTGERERAELHWTHDPEDVERPTSLVFHSERRGQRPANNLLRSQCFCMVVGADRGLDYQLSYKSRWTLLAKLMHRFHAALERDPDRVDRLKDLFDRTERIFYEVEPFSDFATELRSRAAELGAGLEYGLELDFSAYDPTNFFHSLRVYPETHGVPRSFDELGTGQEQILAVAFAYAYATAFGAESTDGLLMIIEEPEAHLHPLAQRWLGRKVYELASAGVQIIITTHSPAFVDLLNIDGLALVRKPNEGACTHVIQRNLGELAEYCSERGAGEKARPTRIAPFYAASVTDEIAAGFFARTVVLVEGATESLALPALLEAAGLDTIEHGIAILNVGGIGCLPRWWRLFTAYGIPTYVIFDRDSDDDHNLVHRADVLNSLEIEVNDFEQATQGGSLWSGEQCAVFIQDFEHAMRDLFASQYEELEATGRERLGSTAKPLVGRYACERLQRHLDIEGWNAVTGLVDAIRQVTVPAIVQEPPPEG